MSNQLKLNLALVAVLTGIFSGLLYVLYLEDREHLRAELSARAAAISATAERLLASQGALAELSAQQALCESLAEIEDVLWVELFDREGKVVAHSIVDRIGHPPLPIHREYVDRILAGESEIWEWDEERNRFNYFLPVSVGSADNATAVLELVLDTRSQSAELFAQLGSHVSYFGFSAIAILLTVLFGRRYIELARAEKLKAEQSVTRLGEIIDASVNEVYVFDAQTMKFDSANRGARENLGYTMAELRELTPLDLKPNMSADEFDRLLAPLRDGREARIQFATEHRRKDGSLYPVRVNLGVSEVDGEKKYLAMIVDETATRQAEEELRQAQKMEAVGQLSAGVAHDFNNLLTAVRGCAELIRLKQDNPAIEDDLDRMDAAIDHATVLTRKLLTFGRRRASAPVVCDLNRAITDLLPILHRLIREDIVIEFSPSAGPAPVLMDAGHVEQIVTNIAINSQDAMPEGGSLRIAVSVEAANVVLSMADSGEGIPAENIERVTEPFFSTKPMGEGTGLGLSTVHGIVRQANGRLQIESEPGNGTKVVIRLPLSGEGERKAEPAQETSPRGAGERVLVCEDDENVREITRQYLELAGYVVICAENPVQALRMLGEHPDIQLLLSDIVMPDMSGYELATRALDACPGLKVLFMSGYDPGGLTQKDKAWADAMVLDKPFTSDGLLREVAAALQTEKLGKLA